MNTSKLLLSSLRNGDFAHPGELEAIDLAMATIPKNKNQWLLDVGCGLGGTAHYLQQQGFGKVVGIDIDIDAISHAKQHYPDALFQTADATQASNLNLDNKFNVIYFFSSFFSIPKQHECLLNMSRIAADQAQLIIFDYSLLQRQAVDNPFHWSKTVKHCNPIYLAEFEASLFASGWQLKDSLDLSLQFKRWYQCLLGKFREKREIIEKKFGIELVNTMYAGYEELLQLIEDRKMGGIVVYAEKAVHCH